MEIESLLMMIQDKDPGEILMYLLFWMFVKSHMGGVKAESEAEKKEEAAKKRENAVDLLVAAIEHEDAKAVKEKVATLSSDSQISMIIEAARLRQENGTGAYSAPVDL